jgi:signal peptidase II
MRVPNFEKLHARPLLHLVLGVVAVALDVWSKGWARATFSGSGRAVPVVGDWLRFRLVFNENAAFGVQFQKLLPFVHPAVFYGVVFLVLLAVLLRTYFRPAVREDAWARLGIVLIIAGGMGNTIDRVVHHKVTDFIDVDFFDLSWDLGPLGQLHLERWPVINLADIWITVGGIYLLFSASFLKEAPWRRSPQDTTR